MIKLSHFNLGMDNNFTTNHNLIYLIKIIKKKT